MKINFRVKSVSTIPAILAALMISVAGNATMQGQTVQGVINGRSGATMTLQTVDTPKLVVLLTPTTEVDEVQGVLKARKKQMAVTSLIPGLPVEVQGTTNDQGQLVADSVKFKGNDLKAAMDAQAGLQPTIAAQAADQQRRQTSRLLRSRKRPWLRNRRSSALQTRRLPLIKPPSQLPTSASASWATITFWARSPSSLATVKRSSNRSTSLNCRSWLSRH